MSPRIFNLKICRILFATCLSALCLSALSVHATTITVINTNDSGAGSLRQALADANDGDTIDFSVTGTITLTTGELLVNDSITISGPGANTLSVNGNAASRVFHISSGKTVTISGLTITNGSAGAGNGGGIYNDHATLTINNSTVSGNSASSGDGGGICNNAEGSAGLATLIVNNSTVSGNSASSGGGIFNNGAYPGGAITTINNSTISGNVGGGIYNNGATGTTPGTPGFAALTVSGCTVSGNSASGIYNSAKSNFTGINGFASLTVTNSTFSGNGIVNYSDGPAIGTAPLIIGHTILASGGIDNPYGGGRVTSLGYNLSSDGGGGYLTAIGDQINTDPMLGPLQDNGGPTFTMLPLTGSPAVDAGGPAEFDQRGPGYLRVVNHIDIGAVEVQAIPSPTPTPTATSTPTATATATATATPTPTPTATPSHPTPPPHPTPRRH